MLKLCNIFLLLFSLAIPVVAATPDPPFAETSAANITLSDPHSGKRVLGENLKLLPAHVPLPKLLCDNADRTERMTLTFHNGAVDGSFNEIAVERRDASASTSPCSLKEFQRFVTGKGIAIGMSAAKAEEILGKPHRISGDGAAKTFHYRLDDFEHSDFLKRFHLPIYYGEYRFEQDRLTRFAFGFEYP